MGRPYAVPFFALQTPWPRPYPAAPRVAHLPRHWQTLLGEHEELTQRGIPQTGTLNYGGPVVTASGLVFLAATMDSKIRAFDIGNGDLLWSADLPAPAYSTPAVYAVDGRQYVALACGGGKLGSKSSDAYVAFALPNES